MNRKKRAAIAEETVQITDRGSYQVADGTEVSIQREVAEAKSSTVLYDLGTMPPLPAVRFDSEASIEVTDETSFAAIRRSARSSDDHVGCLNFASAKNPGGGFLGGSQAQEEALSRSSALYACLQTQFELYYEANRAHTSSLYLDRAIVSPRVPFFRDDDANLLSQPVICSVITSPAPNAGAVMKNEPEKKSQVEATLVRRAEMVLRCAALHQVDALILGAWGCGVFRNQPQMVAESFRRWLLPGKGYERHFRRVILAVFDPTEQRENFKAFSRVFEV